jgi:hypothetical protein
VSAISFLDRPANHPGLEDLERIAGQANQKGGSFGIRGKLQSKSEWTISSRSRNSKRLPTPNNDTLLDEVLPPEV